MVRSGMSGVEIENQEGSGDLAARLDQMLAALGDAKTVMIVPHNDPDPDAIASAVALCYLLAELRGIRGQIAYRGIVGRAENKSLVQYLAYPLQPLRGANLRRAKAVALVDTQPAAGNNPLPPDTVPAIVLDHHPWRESTARAAYHDVRSDVGALSSILTGYLRAAGLEPPSALATALFYGIKTDTMGLIRNAGPEDVAAYLYLQSRVEIQALLEIETAQVPAEYFVQLDAALHAARVYDQVVISYLGKMARPDLAAELADLLLRLKGMQWAICMGVYDQELILAVRTRNRKGGAGLAVQAIVGNEGTAGGHGTMAAGHVPLNRSDPRDVASRLSHRALQQLARVPQHQGQPLIGP